jgi:hypothetical protein
MLLDAFCHLYHPYAIRMDGKWGAAETDSIAARCSNPLWHRIAGAMLLHTPNAE